MRQRSIILDTAADIDPVAAPREDPADPPAYLSKPYRESQQVRVPMPGWLKEPGELPPLGQEISPAALPTPKTASVVGLPPGWGSSAAEHGRSQAIIRLSDPFLRGDYFLYGTVIDPDLLESYEP